MPKMALHPELKLSVEAADRILSSGKIYQAQGGNAAIAVARCSEIKGAAIDLLERPINTGRLYTCTSQSS